MPERSSEAAATTAAGHGPHAGLSAQVELIVGEEDTAEHFRSGDVPVLATPRLLALCEEATCRATDGHLEDSQASVATRVQFDHLAPVGVGSVVLAEATLVKVEGRRLIFTVSAARLEGDGGGLVGAGRVRGGPGPRDVPGQGGRDWASPDDLVYEVGSGDGAARGAGPVVASFVTFGLFWGSWAVMLFDIQRAYSLSDAELGVVLAIAIAVAGASSAVMAHLADRVGARRMLWLALVAWSVLLCGLALTQQRWVFVVVLVLTEVAGGSVDTAMNAEASHRLVNHPSMLVRLHALFNTGALVGAASAALVIHAGVSWRWMWPAIAVVGLAVALWAASTDPGAYGAAATKVEGDGAERRSAHPLRRLRRDGLVVLLFVFALAEVTEGGVDTWGVLFLRNHLATGVLLGAGAYVVGQAVAATTRGAGGSLLGRLSSRAALVVGGCVAGGGILLESVAPAAGLAAVGLALGAGGASLFWPLIMSSVSRAASQLVSAVGTFTAAGYVGWVAGAPIVGWVSQAWGPSRGLQVLAVAAFGVAVITVLSGRRGAGAGSCSDSGGTGAAGSLRLPVMILQSIETPADVKALTSEELTQLCEEIRAFIVETVTTTGGHLGSNLGVVELTLALHRVFDSPRDVLLWDTGHQAYVHKLLTGRRYGFKGLRQAGGLSGYPNRAESEHDWIENSHASTALSYVHGIASGFALRGVEGERRVVAVVGDGALTGGMAYEALNNLGHSCRRVVVVLNDNGRSYAPTVSQLSQSLTTLRLNPTYTAARERWRQRLRDLPGFGELAYSSVRALDSAVREMVTPHTFFEALGVRYVGPIDGHDITHMEQAFAHAVEWDGPIVVHVLTQKGRGYAPAEEDDVQRLHDFKVPTSSGGGVGGGTGVGTGAGNVVGSSAGIAVGGPGSTDGGGLSSLPPSPQSGSETETEVDGAPQRATTYGDAFSRALLAAAEEDPRIVALTAAMPGPTGLLPFQARFPDRFYDVGIAEQHEVTAAAGMAMAGLRPVVAVYSTFLSRAFDQANLDVGLHGCPVVFVLDRAGITGDDGPSHHGILDLALALSIPGMTVFAPSAAEEVEPMLRTALSLSGPSTIRFPKTAPRHVAPDEVGDGLSARRLRRGDGSVCMLGVGKMVGPCLAAADELGREGVEATVWDARVISPPDVAMLADAARHQLVVTAEDGVRFGGAGAFLIDAMSAQVESEGLPMPAIRGLGIPRQFVMQGKADDILGSLGLDGAGIAESVRRVKLEVPAAEPPH